MHLPKKRVLLVDLARQLQLFTSTVSRAPAGQKDISQVTQARVQQLVEQLGYLPNNLAAALRRGRSQTIGLLMPHINGYFFPTVMMGIEWVASATGYNVVMCQSNDDVRREQDHIATLLAARVEGIILSVAATTQANTSHLERVRQQGTPQVFFDRVPDLAQSTAVLLVDFQGAYRAVVHLIGQGGRRIAHFAGLQHLNTSRNRYLDYRQALHDHGLPAPPEWVYTVAASTLAEGRAGMRHLLALAAMPDAVFAAYAYPAVGAQLQCLCVPRDIALVCFSNEPYTSITQLELTAIDQRAEQMGETAVQLLLQLLKQKSDFQPPHLLIEPVLHVRSSSLRADSAVTLLRTAA